MGQLVEEDSVIRMRGFKRFPLGHPDDVFAWGIAGTPAPVLNRRATRHFGVDLFVFLDGVKVPVDLRWGREVVSFALEDIEDAVIAEKRDFLGFAVFLVLKDLPEDDGKR